MAQRFARLATMAASLVLVVGLSACGVKGPLEAPTGSVSSGDIVEGDTTTTTNERKSTVLDGLLE